MIGTVTILRGAVLTVRDETQGRRLRVAVVGRLEGEPESAATTLFAVEGHPRKQVRAVLTAWLDANAARLDVMLAGAREREARARGRAKGVGDGPVPG